MAEFVTEPAPEQGRDTLGLAAGIFFTVVGLAYLIGGNHVVSDHWGLVLPVALVLLGAVGLAGSGLVRGPRHRPVPPDAEDPA